MNFMRKFLGLPGVLQMAIWDIVMLDAELYYSPSAHRTLFNKKYQDYINYAEQLLSKAIQEACLNLTANQKNHLIDQLIDVLILQKFKYHPLTFRNFGISFYAENPCKQRLIKFVKNCQRTLNQDTSFEAWLVWLSLIAHYAGSIAIFITPLLLSFMTAGADAQLLRTDNRDDKHLHEQDLRHLALVPYIDPQIASHNLITNSALMQSLQRNKVNAVSTAQVNNPIDLTDATIAKKYRRDNEFLDILRAKLNGEEGSHTICINQMSSKDLYPLIKMLATDWEVNVHHLNELLESFHSKYKQYVTCTAKLNPYGNIELMLRMYYATEISAEKLSTLQASPGENGLDSLVTFLLQNDPYKLTAVLKYFPLLLPETDYFKLYYWARENKIPDINIAIILKWLGNTTFYKIIPIELENLINQVKLLDFETQNPQFIPRVDKSLRPSNAERHRIFLLLSTPVVIGAIAAYILRTPPFFRAFVNSSLSSLYYLYVGMHRNRGKKGNHTIGLETTRRSLSKRRNKKLSSEKPQEDLISYAQTEVAALTEGQSWLSASIESTTIKFKLIISEDSDHLDALCMQEIFDELCNNANPMLKKVIQDFEYGHIYNTESKELRRLFSQINRLFMDKKNELLKTSVIAKFRRYLIELNELKSKAECHYKALQNTKDDFFQNTNNENFSEFSAYSKMNIKLIDEGYESLRILQEDHSKRENMEKKLLEEFKALARKINNYTESIDTFFSNLSDVPQLNKLQYDTYKKLQRNYVAFVMRINVIIGQLKTLKNEISQASKRVKEITKEMNDAKIRQYKKTQATIGIIESRAVTTPLALTTAPTTLISDLASSELNTSDADTTTILASRAVAIASASLLPTATTAITTTTTTATTTTVSVTIASTVKPPTSTNSSEANLKIPHGKNSNIAFARKPEPNKEDLENYLNQLIEKIDSLNKILENFPGDELECKILQYSSSYLIMRFFSALYLLLENFSKDNNIIYHAKEWRNVFCHLNETLEPDELSRIRDDLINQPNQKIIGEQFDWPQFVPGESKEIYKKIKEKYFNQEKKYAENKQRYIEKRQNIGDLYLENIVNMILMLISASECILNPKQNNTREFTEHAHNAIAMLIALIGENYKGYNQTITNNPCEFSEEQKIILLGCINKRNNSSHEIRIQRMREDVLKRLIVQLENISEIISTNLRNSVPFATTCIPAFR